MSKTAFYNGTVYTADRRNPKAEAFVVEDGRFLWVGTNEELAGCDRMIDLEGQCVIPGLVDSHCHMLAGVTQDVTSMLFVDEKTTPETLGRTLADLVAGSELSGRRVVAAMGIDLTKGEFSADNIDCVISDRPVIVFSNDGHGLLLNSFAMNKLGIDKDTPDPGPESYYARDREGNPTGLVIEIAAMRPCKAILPSPGIKEYIEIIPDIAAGYTSLGYTTVFEAMSVYDYQTDVLEALHLLDKEGSLKLRVSTSFGYNGEDFMPAGDVVEIMQKNREKYTSENLKCYTLKLITDGTIEERTALLYEPYSDDTANCGSEALIFEDMQRGMNMAAAAGFDIHIHAIGDKAVGRAIDAFCSIGEMKGTKTIAHNQVYTDADIERMIKAGDIFFQTTPQWMKGDEHTRKCLGKERFLKQFPVGTMQKMGVKVSFGSDSCLEPETADAFFGMYCACTRGDRSLWKEAALPPSGERLTRMESLYAYTINGAMQLSLEHETGSISEGKSADFLILDRDIIECPAEELKGTKVLKTFFRGELL